ncbi:MAG: hypothetical protein M1820_000554 [Bogoriella megaspora]|nr:MAG: hypothetical protein M1820_000554 [Bogoriella megaspora]
MSSKNRTDKPEGIDDILALLLALSGSQDELELLLISVTFGNVEVLNCLRNVVSLFHTIEKELEWRKNSGRTGGFETLKKFKPKVAVGADEPLADQLLMADYFHGIDGLGGIHSSHPHLSPSDTWKNLFTEALASGSSEEKEAAHELQHSDTLFTPISTPAHEEILRLLRENPPNSITIIAIGPLTNLARTAATDPETFLRVKEVVVMGGAISEPGNVCDTIPSTQPPSTPPSPPPLITPTAEFNIYADSIAASRIFALTSPNPSSTMPPPPPSSSSNPPPPPPPFLGPYPPSLSQRLNLTLFPLDITTTHLLTRSQFHRTVSPLVSSGSPLAKWCTAFMDSTFSKMESLMERLPGADPGDVGLSLHDPLCVWYVLTQGGSRRGQWKKGGEEDVRVETSGQWTRGMCVVDRRGRREIGDGEGEVVGEKGEVKGDHGGWLSRSRGNRVRRVVETPGVEVFAGELLERIFGV